MKVKIILLVLAYVVMLPNFVSAKNKKQNEDKYTFQTIAEVKATPVKNQYKSGTCWSFATTSFVEAEILRIKQKTVDLSEMFSVYHAYESKARSYVQLHGLSNFGPGGQAHDVMDVIRDFGVITEEAYNGLNYGTDKHVHGEMDDVLHNFVKAIVKNSNHKITPVWPLAFMDILNRYLGEPPTQFNFEGKNLTPIQLRDQLGVVTGDYIELTSYEKHSFYKPFRLEIPDNWSFNSSYYNLPVNELMKVMDNALKTGYSVCWDGDVSEKGFSYKNGVAIVPEINIENLSGTELSKWEKLTKEDLKNNAYKFNAPVPEKEISQDDRQQAFENYSATDDHLMHLTALVKDQNGTLYYKTKNSWGDSNKMGGYLNMSSSFVRLNTIAIMVHKDALPKEIREKLGIK